LTRDQKKGVEIFTKRSSDELVSERMRAEVILENIQIYRDALAYYLEFLIYTKNVKVEHVASFFVESWLKVFKKVFLFSRKKSTILN